VLCRGTGRSSRTTRPVKAGDRPQLHHRLCHQRVTQTLDLLPVELQGRNLFDLGDFESPADQELARALQQGLREPFRDRRFVILSKDGTRHIFRLSGLPVYDTHDGRFVGYRGTALDITETIEAETRTRRVQQRLEDALETTVAGFLLVDPVSRWHRARTSSGQCLCHAAWRRAGH